MGQGGSRWRPPTVALQSEMRLACNFCDDMDEAHTPVLPIGSLKCTHRLSPACTAHKNLVPRAELAAQHTRRRVMMRPATSGISWP